MRINVIGFVALLVVCLGSPARPDSQAQPSGALPEGQPVLALVGLWGCEQSFGPLVRGELTIDARGGASRGMRCQSSMQKTRFNLLCPATLANFADVFILSRAASAFSGTGYSRRALPSTTHRAMRVRWNCRKWRLGSGGARWCRSTNGQVFIFPFNGLPTGRSRHFFETRRPIAFGDRLLMWN